MCRNVIDNWSYANPVEDDTVTVACFFKKGKYSFPFCLLYCDCSPLILERKKEKTQV